MGGIGRDAGTEVVRRLFPPLCPRERCGSADLSTSMKPARRPARGFFAVERRFTYAFIFG